MTAYQFSYTAKQPVPKQVPIPLPGPDEVLVKVLASGVCHTDVTLIHHPEFVPTLAQAPSFTLGHEAAGIIESVGERAKETYPHLTKGTYVAVHCMNACYEPTCETCSSGKSNLCHKLPWLGMGANGTWASHVLARARCVLPVPGDTSSIPPEVAAIATDAVLTPYHALKTVGELKKGQTVLIVGCGGLGLNAIQVAKNYLGAGVVVGYDLREEALERAKESGADYTATPDTFTELFQSKNLAADVIVDFVGIQATFDKGLEALQVGGKIIVIGMTAPQVALDLYKGMVKGATVALSTWGTLTELEEVLQGIADGKLKPKVEKRPLAECGKMVEELRDGKIAFRVAVVP
ncbi:alcohol dehydogenase [Panus rudis PR-1116 ss-1]|nr:alcohol dehydogenase [Panus rudis PR-1116 ss-1]